MTEPTVEQYNIVVDPNLTFDQMIEAGDYYGVDVDIAAHRFPVSGVRGGKFAAKLVHFNREMGDEEDDSEVNRELDRMGLQRTNVAQTLAFGAQHPHVQRMHWIISGAIIIHGSRRVFLQLGGGLARRYLRHDVLRPGRKWPLGDHFLAVPIQ